VARHKIQCKDRALISPNVVATSEVRIRDITVSQTRLVKRVARNSAYGFKLSGHKYIHTYIYI
jgi:hypothetical protein